MRRWFAGREWRSIVVLIANVIHRRVAEPEANVPTSDLSSPPPSRLEDVARAFEALTLGWGCRCWQPCAELADLAGAVVALLHDALVRFAHGVPVASGNAVADLLHGWGFRLIQPWVRITANRGGGLRSRSSPAAGVEVTIDDRPRLPPRVLGQDQRIDILCWACGSDDLVRDPDAPKSDDIPSLCRNWGMAGTPHSTAGLSLMRVGDLDQTPVDSWAYEDPSKPGNTPWREPPHPPRRLDSAARVRASAWSSPRRCE